MSHAPDQWQTPPQFSGEMQIAPEKVIAEIRAGRLEAVDVSAPGSVRPRYRISPQAKAAWLLRRRVVPPAPIVRRRRSSGPAVKEYF